MKLSDVRGDRTLDVIADLIDPIAEIASDEEAVALFRREKVPEGVEPRDFFVRRARKAAPALLKGHKRQMIQILATIEGTDPADYAESLNLAKLLRDLVELLTDEEFVAFLSPSETGTEGAAPGSA